MHFVFLQAIEFPTPEIQCYIRLYCYSAINTGYNSDIKEKKDIIIRIHKGLNCIQKDLTVCNRLNIFNCFLMLSFYFCSKILIKF